MILGLDELLQRIREDRLIEHLSERELQNPEGVGVDLRIAKAFRLSGEGFLGITERSTPQTELIAAYKEKDRKMLILQPGDYVLTETIERFNMPGDLLAILKPRTTMQRSGVIVRMGEIDPGYSGAVHPALYNAGPATITIEMGARYVNVFFIKIDGRTSRYRGQWQGGRVTTDGKETQV